MVSLVSPTSRLRRLVSAAGLSVAAAATAVFALPSPTSPEACPPIDPPAATTSSAPIGATSAAPRTAGIRVFVDPATGRIRRATPEERRRLAVATARDRSARTYAVRTRRDGTRIVKLDETFLMTVVGRANPDGTVSYRCRTESAPANAAAEESEK